MKTKELIEAEIERLQKYKADLDVLRKTKPSTDPTEIENEVSHYKAVVVQISTLSWVLLE